MDLIQKMDGDLCVSALAASEDARVGDITVSILGVSFLKSVVSVFDFGKNEMRFAKRWNYIGMRLNVFKLLYECEYAMSLGSLICNA